jgi:phosphatidyl-myo-inositol dimannoside synthase
MNHQGKSIWLATEDYPPKGGGLSRWSHDTARTLVRLGYDVTVLARRAVTRDEGDGVHVVGVPGPSFDLLGFVHFARAFRRLAGCRGCSPDAIVCSTWHVAEGALLSGAGAPVICAVMGKEVFERRRGSPARRRRVLERVALAAAASNFTAGRLREVAPRARIAVGVTGVDTALFTPEGPRRPRDAALQLLSAGRLVPRKRFDLVIDAVAAARSRGMDAALWIAGKGPLEGELMARAALLGDAARFLGAVDDSELACLYRSADLFVSPCQSDVVTGDVEGFGLTFIEASASGTAVAGLAEGGVTDAVEEGVSGILTRREDFTERVLDLLGRADLMARFGERGRRRVLDRFDLLEVVPGLIARVLPGNPMA